MNFAAAILYLMSSSVLLSVLLGFCAGSLGRWTALASLAGGVVVAVVALWKSPRDFAPARRPRGWEWVAVGIFGWFALRAMLPLVTIEGDEIKTIVWNNVGDLSLHLTFINYFANGAPFWPESPIFAGGKLSYSVGTDLFNSLLVLAGVDVFRGLVWVGLVCTAVTGMALWRWGRAFATAGFLLNGGLAALALLLPVGAAAALTGMPVGFPTEPGGEWPRMLDFQGNHAWKNIPLTMFITQRGFLFALPAGLLLLCSWRTRFFGAEERGWRLPFAGELLLYAAMPFFHVHTFIALSLLLACFFIGWVPARRKIALLVAAAFVPASALLYLSLGTLKAAPEPMVYDMSQVENPPPRPRAKVLGWNPGWMVNDDVIHHAVAGDAPRDEGLEGTGTRLKKFVYFWTVNFGILPALVLLTLLVALRMALKRTIHVWPLLGGAAGVLVVVELLWSTEAWREMGLFDFLRSPHGSGVSFLPLLAAVLAAIGGAMRPPSAGARAVRAGIFALAALFALAAAFPMVAELLADIPLNALPLIAASIATVVLLVCVSRSNQPPQWSVVFIVPALWMFVLCCNVKFAPWAWDNTKIMIWSYLVLLPFVWDFVITRFGFWTRAIVCEVLFFSGFLSLYGGLNQDIPRTVARLSDVQAAAQAVKEIPITETFVASPTYSHPLLLAGRKVLLGYDGHISSHGLDAGFHKGSAEAILRGYGDWRVLMAEHRARYIFYGPREREAFGEHQRAWQYSTARTLLMHDFEIYDTHTPSVPLDDGGETE